MLVAAVLIAAITLVGAQDAGQPRVVQLASALDLTLCVEAPPELQLGAPPRLGRCSSQSARQIWTRTPFGNDLEPDWVR